MRLLDPLRACGRGQAEPAEDGRPRPGTDAELAERRERLPAEREVERRAATWPTPHVDEAAAARAVEMLVHEPELRDHIDRQVDERLVGRPEVRQVLGQQPGQLLAQLRSALLDGR